MRLAAVRHTAHLRSLNLTAAACLRKTNLRARQAALFDKVGIRTMRIETDPFGNFLGQGYEVGSGRDCVARQPVSSRRCLERRTSNELTFDCALARDGVSIRPQGNIRCA